MIQNETFCKLFYGAHYIPIALYKRNDVQNSAGFLYDTSSYIPNMSTLFEQEEGSSIETTIDNAMFGKVIIENTDHYFIIGPVFSIPSSDYLISKFMKENDIPSNLREKISQFINGIPTYSYNHFINLIVFLHYQINGTSIDIVEYISQKKETSTQNVLTNYVNASYNNRDERIQHDTYFFEQQVLDYISQGKPEKLQSFLHDSSQKMKLYEGKLAETAIRQAKNIFIGSATLFGKIGAISGGSDIEETYHLIDMYIQECERLVTIDEIKKLQLNMIIDFTNRVSRKKLSQKLSFEIRSCIQFINSHINESISLSDVSKHISRSRAYTIEKFKDEVGINVGEYILQCKMDEAKILLQYTNKSLAEISNYLSYSSQSYFQNVFKKRIGVTPKQYRKQYIKKDRF